MQPGPETQREAATFYRSLQTIIRDILQDRLVMNPCAPQSAI